ncbi:MAG: hypothetical protein ACJA0H_002104, partial [Francisellaceae bacterium]
MAYILENMSCVAKLLKFNHNKFNDL